MTTAKLQATMMSGHILWTTTDKKFLVRKSFYVTPSGVVERSEDGTVKVEEGIIGASNVKVVVGQSPRSPLQDVPYVVLSGEFVEEIEIETEEDWPTNPQCIVQRKCLEDHEVYEGKGTSDICKDGCVRGRPSLMPAIEEKDGREIIKLVSNTDKSNKYLRELSAEVSQAGGEVIVENGLPIIYPPQ